MMRSGERGKLLIAGVVLRPVDRADDEEFVAADTRHEIPGAQVRFQHLRGVHQHGVAGGMAERVVDLLEAIEIDVQEARALALGVDPLDIGRQYLVEISAVRQACQRIMQRVELDPLLGGFQFGVAASRSACWPASAFRSALRRPVTSQLTPTILSGSPAILVGLGAFAEVSNLAIGELQAVVRLEVLAVGDSASDTPRARAPGRRDGSSRSQSA